MWEELSKREGLGSGRALKEQTVPAEELQSQWRGGGLTAIMAGIHGPLHMCSSVLMPIVQRPPSPPPVVSIGPYSVLEGADGSGDIRV